MKKIKNKILSAKKAQKKVLKWKSKGETIVFTNGCFDILHYGHIHYLAQAKKLGNRLIIGLNSSASVSRLKGKHRPINDDATRSHLLAALEMVDLVIFFDQDTPLELIIDLEPNILVKGGDYKPKEIVGYSEVKSKGGKVKILPFIDGYSTTKIEQKIKKS